jgi:hypothetical protein
MVPRKAPMVGFGGGMAGLPVWGSNENALKNRDIMVYELAALLGEMSERRRDRERACGGT